MNNIFEKGINPTYTDLDWKNLYNTISKMISEQMQQYNLVHEQLISTQPLLDTNFFNRLIQSKQLILDDSTRTLYNPKSFINEYGYLGYKSLQIILCPTHKVISNIPNRHHKKKRIQKKYIKLYGYRYIDEPTIEDERIILVENQYLYMNSETYKKLKEMAM